MKTLTPEELGSIRITCTTQAAIIVAYLWYVEDWVPTHQLQGVETPFGFIGSAGAVRARELSRNDCSEKLKGRVERARGGAIGLDARYEYFRWKPQAVKLSRTDAERIGQENVRMFENYQSTATA